MFRIFFKSEVLPLFLLLYVLLTSFSCSKPSQLGLSLVEQNQTDIEVVDTISMNISCNTAERTETFNRSLMVCGGYSDLNQSGEWGSVEASVFMNFRLESTGASFNNVVFDSLVLTLAYNQNGHYGELLTNKPTQTSLSWDVLRLTEDIVTGEPYKSDATFQTGDVLKSGFTFNPNDTLGVNINGVDYVPHIRINLDDFAGEELGKFLLNPQGPDSNIYESNLNFKDWFKGICIRPSSGSVSNSIVKMISKDAQTKLTLYYTDTSGGDSIQYTFDYITNEDTEVVNSFSHVHPPELTDNSPSDTIVYVQGLDGIHTKIDFPYVSNLGNIIVNKAELLIMVEDTGTLEYPEPITIGAKVRDNSGVLQYIDDLNTSLQNVGSYFLYGGALETGVDSVDNFFYRLFITEQMQKIVDGETSEPSIYITTLSALDPQRVKLFNQNSTHKSILYLTYTKLQ